MTSPQETIDKMTDDYTSLGPRHEAYPHIKKACQAIVNEYKYLQKLLMFSDKIGWIDARHAHYVEVLKLLEQY